MNKLALFSFSCLVFFNAIAQQPKQPSSSEIYHAIQKLNFLGSALYIAAHPDDENTRLISYLSNNTHARTAYLSLTRGDGGQNLIGSELRESLGVLRTQELLAARRVDGGTQFFSRANDFGFSKHPDETLEIWNKAAVLSDVVKIIRDFKPDVIINRFDHRTPGTTHGHHTSSAMLSFEAFDLAADKKAFKDESHIAAAWETKRLFFNPSWWFYGSTEKFEEADKSAFAKMDVGTYYPLLGTSNNEIASLASSQHLCQGFGRLGVRGSEMEYLELLKGTPLVNKKNIFAGINTTWSRMTGGKPIGAILDNVEQSFNFKNPQSHLTELLQAYSLLLNTTESDWKSIKLEELKGVISAVTGLYLEANSVQANANPGEKITIAIEIVNRSGIEMSLASLFIENTASKTSNLKLLENKKVTLQVPYTIANKKPFTSPYWLQELGTLGMYTVTNKTLIGLPETPAALTATFNLNIEGTPLPVSIPVKYGYAKPEKGALVQPFEIVPKVTVSFKDKVLLFPDSNAKTIPVTIKAHADAVSGVVKLQDDDAWGATNNTQAYSIAKKGDEQTVYFKITPPIGESEGYLHPLVTYENSTTNKELTTIAYDHIPTQTVLLPAKTKVVRLALKKQGTTIGYIQGAGDAIPESLRQIGYTVQLIAPEAITKIGLQHLDAVVLGIRAYNVLPELAFKQKILLDYVKAGGTMIVQYNTVNRRSKGFENIAPYPLQLSRDRVTDEQAAVTFLTKNHPILNKPNKINAADFDGWVQERGLYFPDNWAPEFTPILSMHDKNETPKEGSLLVAQYGKGYYIYTGLSFFRELPAGVSGAYKLFANMLSIGKEDLNDNGKQ